MFAHDPNTRGNYGTLALITMGAFPERICLAPTRRPDQGQLSYYEGTPSTKALQDQPVEEAIKCRVVLKTLIEELERAPFRDNEGAYAARDILCGEWITPETYQELHAELFHTPI